MPSVIDMKPNVVKPVFDIVEAVDGSMHHQTPEQAQPAFIKGEGPVADRTRQRFASTSRLYAEINLKRVTAAPDYDNEVKRASNTIGQLITEARNETKAELKELDDKLTEATGFKVEPARWTYLVGTVQSLSPNERINLVNELVEGGHGPELAMLSSLATKITGLPKEVRDNIKARLFAAKEPALFAKLQAAQNNLNRIEALSITNAGVMAKFAAPLNVAATAAKQEHRSVVD